MYIPQQNSVVILYVELKKKEKALISIVKTEEFSTSIPEETGGIGANIFIDSSQDASSQYK